MIYIVKLMAILAIFVTYVAGAESPGVSQKPFFYEVSLNGNVSYILGTMHIGVSLEDLPPSISEKLANANRIIIEEKIYDPIDAHQMLLASTDIWAAGLQERNQHEGLLTSPLNSSQKQAYLKFGIPAKIIDLLRCDDLGYNMLAPQWLFPKLVSMDTQILDFAYSSGREIVELDDANLREETTEAAGPTKQSNQSCKLVDASEGSTHAQVAELMIKKRKDYLAGTLTDRDNKSVAYRNRIWAEHLFTYLRGGHNFVAVGVGHLIEPTDNLIDLLKAKGFSIKRIPN